MIIAHCRVLSGALLVALLSGCATNGPEEAAMQVVDTEAKSAPIALPSDAGYPLPVERMRTTDPAIFMGNLDARIATHEKYLATQESAAHRAALAGALNHRFRIVGRVEDGENAMMHLQKALAIDPDNADALLAYASTLSAFHRFDEADAAIAKARVKGVNVAALQRIERDLQVGRGQYAALAEDFAHSQEPVADFYELAHRADLRMLQGDLDGATHWYRAAQSLYVDVDPLPLAWLYTQQGIALLRYGQFAEAKPFFAAAHERLPQYALAAEHLAECEYELGNLDRARALYHDVIAQTNNPEFIAALADVEQKAGNDSRAADLRAQAKAGYAALLQRHRAAYAQHAAEFMIDSNQSAEALTLARENLALRKDIGSWILFARSAAAAGDFATACDANLAARASKLNPPELAELDALSARCDQSS